MATPYISEVKYLGGPSQDFIEIAVDAGTDVSNLQVVVYHPDGTVRSTNLLGAVVNTIAGRDIYVIDTATSGTFDGLHKYGGVALYDSTGAGTVYQFVSFDDNAATITATEGPAIGLTSTDIGLAGSGVSLETTDYGATYHTLTPPTSGTIPCFVAGTLIGTARGDRRVEDLEIGDGVVTLDHGVQTIRWIGRKTVHNPGAALRPVCIRAGRFGPGIPQTDLWVSPNHRLLMQGGDCTLLFGQSQVLVAAKHLATALSPASESVTYIHLLFDAHEVVLSNNMPSESFHPGQAGLDAFDAPVRDEVLDLFPELRTAPLPERPLARMELRGFEAEVLRDRITA